MNKVRPRLFYLSRKSVQIIIANYSNMKRTAPENDNATNGMMMHCQGANILSEGQVTSNCDCLHYAPIRRSWPSKAASPYGADIQTWSSLTLSRNWGMKMINVLRSWSGPGNWLDIFEYFNFNLNLIINSLVNKTTIILNLPNLAWCNNYNKKPQGSWHDTVGLPLASPYLSYFNNSTVIQLWQKD